MTEEMVFPKIYSYNEVLKSCLAYFKNDELAATTWMNKYAMKNKKGEFLESSPEEMHKRMSIEFARIEKKHKVKETDLNKLSDYGRKREFLTEDAIFNLFKDFKYVIPQGIEIASSVIKPSETPILVP